MTHLKRPICLILVLAAALLPSATLAQGSGEALLYQEEFGSERPAGWELEQGWEVVQEDGNWILSGEGHRWARAGEYYAGDFRLQFRLRLVRGSVHLVYRLNDIGRYFIGFSEEGSSLNKQYWPEDFRGGLASGSTPHSLGAWHQVEIVGEGATLRFLVDGVQEWEYTDPEPLVGGSFAFETLEDGVAQVDDVLIYGPPPPATPTPDPSLSWVRTGGPLGGLGYDVRMRPDNPDRLYVTDAWAGVFMSTDGGATWFPSNEGITTRTGESGDAIPVFCLTIDPHNHDIIWIGTQNVRGIFRSEDGGRTWVEMDNGVVEYGGITFRGITVDPRSSDIVYAAGELSSWLWSDEEQAGREFDKTQGVVYRTTDGGQNWSAIWRGDNLARYVWIDPRDPDVIYISTGIFDREAANSDHPADVPGGEGILKSTDGGQTWQQVNNGISNLYVGTLFMHPENPDILLAGAGNNAYAEGSGIFITADGGGSWERVLRDDGINAVEFAESDPNIAYAGSAGAIYRSEDGGLEWERVSSGEGWGPPGVRAGFPIDFQVDPRDPDRIFANNYGGGNFVSEDGGRTWAVASAGYTGAQVRDIDVDPTAPGRIFAAARSGIFGSTDGGGTWVGFGYPPAFVLEWNAVAVDPSNPQHVLAAHNWGGLLVQSHDGGQTWQIVAQSLREGMGWRAIAFAPSDPATVYAGTSGFFSAGVFDDRMIASGVYVSHDGGANWQPANAGPSVDAGVTDIAVDPGNPQRVYAATNQGVLRSTDGGQSWVTGNEGLPGSPVAFSVTAHPSEPDVVFAGLERGGLYRSSDGGEHWEAIAAGLNPESRVNDLVFDPTNPQVVYMADAFSGVYRSTDGGSSWAGISNGLRTRAVNELAISADGLHLYAATEGEGVFRLDLAGEPPAGTVTTPDEPASGDTSPQPAEESPEEPEQANDERGGICGGAIALPLAVVGLAWASNPRRKAS